MSYLSGLQARGIRMKLGAISRVVSHLGNPQNNYRSVLIAGTNGKGSTAAMLASILQRAGYCVGLYTSPHLTTYRERIRVNGKMITPAELAGFVRALRRCIDEEVTYFEFTTALAFSYFAAKRVDIAVLEVGMGGRLDATKIAHPELSVITNVDLEHQVHLGNMLKDIAREKAGIIPKRSFCITAAKQPIVRRVLQEVCKRQDSRLVQLGRDIRIRSMPDGSFSYFGLNQVKLTGIRPALEGDHQRENAALAIAAAQVLELEGFHVPERAIYAGLAGTRWEGRIEVVSRHPLVVLDGAHNPAGIKSLRRALDDKFAWKKSVFVFGALSDKNSRTMLNSLSPLADTLILTSPRQERAAPAGGLALLASGKFRRVAVEPDSAAAFEQALALSRPEDLVCVTGSLYLVGEAKKWFAKNYRGTRK